jgi:hypothetical protein
MTAEFRCRRPPTFAEPRPAVIDRRYTKLTHYPIFPSLDLTFCRHSLSHRWIMLVRIPSSFVCVGLLVGAFPLRAASDITADSPFLPPSNGAAATAVTEGAPIELHGVMTTAEGTSFSIYDTAKKSAQWVRINQAGAPFVIRSHSIVDGNDEVKIDYQGSSLTLALKTPKIGAMARNNPVMAANQPPGGFNRPGGPPNAITQTVVVNPTPADEAARLQAVVEAVAARRAARNQAVQQGGVPPPAVQQPVQPAGNQQGQRGNRTQRQNQR